MTPKSGIRNFILASSALVLSGGAVAVVAQPAEANEVAENQNIYEITNLRSTYQSRDRIVLTWDEVPGVAAYALRIVTIEGDSYEVGYYFVEDNNWLVLKSETGLDYEIGAVPVFDDDVEREIVRTPTLTVRSKGLTPVQDLTWVNKDRDFIEFEWTANEEATKYHIRKEEADGTYSRVGTYYPDDNSGTLNYRVEHLDASTEYTFKVVAMDASGERSTPRYVGTETLEARPQTIQGLRSTHQTRERVVINWEKSQRSGKTYQVSVSEGEFSEENHRTFENSSRWFTYKDLKPGTLYTFRVVDEDPSTEPAYIQVSTKP